MIKVPLSIGWFLDVATVSTITEIGMAGLLPGNEKHVTASTAREGKLELSVDGTVVRDRKKRIALLRSAAGVEVFDIKLEASAYPVVPASR
jgi:hypothetical protein